MPTAQPQPRTPTQTPTKATGSRTTGPKAKPQTAKPRIITDFASI